MTYREVTVNNKDGLNSATAAAIVQMAGKFSSKVLIERGNKKINAKSIMGVLSLGVRTGEEILVVADGDDEQDALNAIESVVG